MPFQVEGDLEGPIRVVVEQSDGDIAPWTQQRAYGSG
jgi:hypothetical protein